jgi:choline kinase
VANPGRRAVVLAAGMGTRMGALARSTPKALLPVGGRPLLLQSLQSLAASGACEEALVIVGHRAEQIRAAVAQWRLALRVRCLENEEFHTTNSMASLALAGEFGTRSGFVLLDGDIGFEPLLLARLLAAGDDVMLLDTEKRWAAMDMRVEVRRGRVWHLDKQLAPGRTDGEFFGMSRFTREGALELFDEIHRYLSSCDRVSWYEFALRALAKRRPIRAEGVGSASWFEIDTVEDLERARRRSAGRGSGGE